jgi:amidase
MSDIKTGPGICRRAFVGSAAALVASAALPHDVAASEPERRRDPVSRAADRTIVEVPIAQLSTGMVSGEYTARSITQAYLDRIAALDHQGPMLHHVIETNPDALSIAESLDAERRAGKIRGPLHGIPVLVKDNIDSADRMTTTAGSLALEGSRSLRDATVVAKLRAAGAIVLGKTNLSEWANFRSTHSSSGW